MTSTFLTGATGTIGSALLPRLLARDSGTVCVLLRARDGAELASRLAGLLVDCNISPAGPRAVRIMPLRGDISEPDFGLDAAAYARLASETTHIIHCAASVKLNMPIEQARATAVVPTRTVLALARRCAAAGSLRKVDLVSTVGVWGRTPGTLPEQPLKPGTDGFHNTYEAAKAEAEQVVWSEGGGLPITVHRPSMVVGETGSGRVIHFQVFYHLCEFLSGVRTFGVMPHLGDTRLDTVPVDWVADAICWASDHAETAGRVFHLCSGPAGAIALTDLQRQVRMLWRAHGRNPPPLRPVGRQLLARLIPLIGAVAGAKTRRALLGLPPVLEYLAEKQSFANAQTAATLAAAGLALPPIASYLDAVLGFYLQPRVKAEP